MTVTKAFLLGVDMPVHLHGVTAKLGHCQNALIRLRSAQGFHVNMPALKIPSSLVEPTRGMVYQAGRVVTLDPIGSLDGMELPPAFIEWHPHGNAREVV